MDYVTYQQYLPQLREIARLSLPLTPNLFVARLFYDTTLNLDETSIRHAMWRMLDDGVIVWTSDRRLRAVHD